MNPKLKKQMLLLAVLFGVWGIVLWNQFGSGAPEAEAAVAVPAPAVEPEPAPAPVVHLEPRPIASKEIVEQQRETSALPIPQDPFSVGVEIEQVESQPEVIENGVSLQLSSTFLGPRGNWAVINGKRTRENDFLEGFGTLEQVGDGWIEIRRLDRTKLRVELSSRKYSEGN